METGLVGGLLDAGVEFVMFCVWMVEYVAALNYAIVSSFVDAVGRLIAIVYSTLDGISAFLKTAVHQYGDLCVAILSAIADAVSTTVDAVSVATSFVLSLPGRVVAGISLVGD